MGEGTIVFNIGLFTKLQNESQVAFVLCHEIAHYHLRHSQNSIERYVNTINSKEYQEELRRIVKSQYQKGKQLETLARSVTFNNRRHTREHESSADSMALELFRNTPFKTEEALNCLTLLDSIDRDKYNVAPALDSTSTSRNILFRKNGYRKNNRCSVQWPHHQKKKRVKTETRSKTHPDCAVRVNQLFRKSKKYSTGNKQLALC